MPSPRPKTVLCFGDANTHGTMPLGDRDDRRRYAPHERWTGVMAQALGDDWRLVEEGLPGRTTVHDDPVEGWTPDGRDRNGLAHLPVALASQRPIDQLVLMLGTNDVKARFGVGAVDIALGLEKCIAYARSVGVGPEYDEPAILLVTPPPVIETGYTKDLFTGAADVSAALPGPAAALAARQGVDFLDAGVVVGCSDIDGLHLDADAHARLGRAIADAIIQG